MGEWVPDVRTRRRDARRAAASPSATSSANHGREGRWCSTGDPDPLPARRRARASSAAARSSWPSAARARVAEARPITAYSGAFTLTGGGFEPVECRGYLRSLPAQRETRACAARATTRAVMSARLAASRRLGRRSRAFHRTHRGRTGGRACLPVMKSAISVSPRVCEKRDPGSHHIERGPGALEGPEFLSQVPVDHGRLRVLARRRWPARSPPGCPEAGGVAETRSGRGPR